MLFLAKRELCPENFDTPRIRTSKLNLGYKKLGEGVV